MPMKALSSLKDTRWRIALEWAELARLDSMLDVIKLEMPTYQQALSERWKEDQAIASSSEEATSEALKLFACLESILPVLDELVQHGLHEDEKSGRMRATITEDDPTKLRVINYCASHLPDLPASIAWQEFAKALVPIIEAIDRSAFEQLLALVTPRTVSCTVDDLKRGRNQSEESDDSEEFDG